MDEATRGLIERLLREHKILTLATVREDGYPQATIVGYVNEGFSIYVATFPESQKVHNIQASDKVSLAVGRDRDDWGMVQALSVGGRANVVQDPEEVKRVIALLDRKYPQLSGMPVPVEPHGISILAIHPEIITVLDYTKGFGHQDIFRVAP